MAVTSSLDQLDAILIRITHEGEARAAFADRIWRSLRLDPLLLEARKSRVEVVYRHGDMAVGRAKLVGVDAEVVRQLESAAGS